MKKLLILFLLLFPIKSFASGYALIDAWDKMIQKRYWVIIIEEDENGKEIKRYGYWYNVMIIKYYVKYECSDGDQNEMTKEVDVDTYWQSKQYNYYVGD
jgi:hypothetical protein